MVRARLLGAVVVVGCGPSLLGDDAGGSASGTEGPISSTGVSASSADESTSSGSCTPTAEVETCNGLDDDCDGEIDEGIPAVTCGMGNCEATVRCEDGVMPECVPGDPAPEVCNLDDDDCDGIVDEGFTFGPLTDPIVLRLDENDTGSCSTCRWAWGTALIPVDGGFLALWNLGLSGGNEQPTLHGRFVDPTGSPTSPIELLRDDFLLEVMPIQALAPMPPLGRPLAVENRTPGQGDVPGLMFGDPGGTLEIVQPVPGVGPRNVERVVWTGERFVAAWEEDDQLRMAVLAPGGSLERMLEVDPFERPARVTFGVFPGRVGVMISRYQSDGDLRTQWFMVLDPWGEVVVPAHELDVEWTTWQRVVGTDEGWLHVRINGSGEPTTRQPLDLEGNPVGDALPFSGDAQLSGSGLSDTFVPRPGLGETLVVWGDSEGGNMHVEFRNGTGEVLRSWQEPLEPDPGYDAGFVVGPHVQLLDDRLLVLWHGLAPDDEPNRVMARSFGCAP